MVTSGRRSGRVDAPAAERVADAEALDLGEAQAGGSTISGD
jgi:hypothetical protein